METQITTLIENTQGEHLSLHAQHGISFLIRHRDTHILFDTAQDDAFIRNARLLREDLGTVRHVVLSHGHYDHVNGLPHLIEQYGTDFELWTHPDLFVPKYARDGTSAVYLGPSYDKAWLEQRGVRHRALTERVTEIAPDVFVISGFGRYNELETRNERFVLLDESGKWKVDDFHDEVAVAVRTGNGLAVLVGCSHPGIMNMLSTVSETFDDPLYAVLGGTHLVEAKGERLESALRYLSADEPAVLGLNHCTGAESMELLEKRNTRFYRNSTGTSLII